jgi:hypothetical protein
MAGFIAVLKAQRLDPGIELLGWKFLLKLLEAG